MKTKKIACLFLSTLIVGSLLSGCGSASKETNSTKGKEGEKVTITYWQHSSQARDNMMEELADEFMKKNSNIEVKLEFIPQDSYSTKLISSLATDAAPDVMQVESGLIGRLVKANAIQPLDEKVLPVDSIKKDFIPASVKSLEVDGKYYGLPTDTQTIVLYWNKDLVQAAGLDSEKGPQTWEEMKDWAKKLTKHEGSQMVQSGWGEKGYHPEVEAFIASNGGKMMDENGKYVFADDPKAIEAIEFLINEYKVDKVYDIQFMKNWAGFRQGKVAMMLGHPAMFGNLKQTAPNVKLGISLIPARNGKRTTTVTSWAYVASKKANSEAATKWIQFLTSEEVEKKWTQKTGELPARKALINDEELVKDPQVKILLSSMNDSEVGRIQMGALAKIWGDGYQKILLTDAPIKETLKNMQNDLNKEIEKDLK